MLNEVKETCRKYKYWIQTLNTQIEIENKNKQIEIKNQNKWSTKSDKNQNLNDWINYIRTFDRGILCNHYVEEMDALC